MSAICTNVTRGDLNIINGVSFNKILEKYMAIILGIECSQVREHVTTEKCVCYKGWGHVQG